MKIVQINALYGVGSTGVIMQDIQEILMDNGIECFCFYSGGKTPLTNGIKIGNLIDRKVHALLSRFFGKQAYYSSIATWFMLRKLSKVSPDIVQLHNIHNNYLNMPMLLKYLAKHDITTVLTLHDCWYYTGGCFHYSAVGCSKWQSQCDHCPKRYQDTPALLKDCSKVIFNDRVKLLSSIRKLAVVGVSNWISQEAKKSVVLKNRQVNTIHNGIDTYIYRPTYSHLRDELKLHGKKIIIGPATKWLSDVNRETFEYFLHHLEPDTVLLIFGCTNMDISVPSNVILYGFIKDRELLASIYTLGDVLVNCSREDTLSTLNLECQSCGTPVVTYDPTALKETVDMKYSFHVKEGDYEALYNKTMEVLNSINDDTSEGCRKFILENFDKKENYKKYISFFNEINNSL